MTIFTDEERAYLRSQPLGRLATRSSKGRLHNNPVGFELTDDETIEIGGHHLADSAKFRNVRRDEDVAFVVDDLVSIDPWRPRQVEIRGRAEALTDVEPIRPGFSREVIRIHPRTIITFGVNPEGSVGRLRQVE